MELCRDRLRGRSYRGLCQRRFAERVHRIGPQRVYRASERGLSRGVPQHLADPLETRDLGCGWRLRLALVANARTREHANKGCSPLFACSYVRVFVQNPGIAPGSGFKPPHYRLQRNEDNRGLRPQDFFVPFFRKKY